MIPVTLSDEDWAYLDAWQAQLRRVAAHEKAKADHLAQLYADTPGVKP